MIRAIPLLLAGLLFGVTALNAAEVIDYNDTVFLGSHETVRYRLTIEDYGGNGGLHVDVYVRGIDGAPRCRVLNSNYSEVKRREDTDGDWIIDFDFTAESPRPRYYIEVDCADPADEGEFEVRIEVNAADPEDGEELEAAVDIDFVKVFTDFDDGGRSDHWDCAAGAGTGAPVALLAGVAGLAVLRRRKRNSPAR